MEGPVSRDREASGAVPGEPLVEVVRGRSDAALARELVDFWVGQGALGEAEARQRLPQAIAVIRGARGEIVGVNSAFAARAPLVGRRFWIYRRFLAPGAGDEAEAALLKAAYEELAASYTGAVEEPLGLCVVLSDRAAMERNPEAVWPEVEMLLAGYTEDGAQVRIRYFAGATI